MSASKALNLRPLGNLGDADLNHIINFVKQPFIVLMHSTLMRLLSQLFICILYTYVSIVCNYVLGKNSIDIR